MEAKKTGIAIKLSASEMQVYEAGKQAGIREVVGFINDLIFAIEGCEFEERLDGDKGYICLDMNENQWKAKLKEWKIKLP